MASRCSIYLGVFRVYLLYWYKSANTDAAALYGVKTVYVTSDSASVYREVGEFQGREGFSFIFTREDRAYYEHDWLLEMRLRCACWSLE